MKILFRTIKYNWRYIFTASNKIAAILFSAWGFVTLVTPTDTMLNCIDNVVLRMIIAVFILMVIYFVIVIGVTIYTKQSKQVKIIDLHSNHSLFVEYGHLFNSGDSNEKKNIAFAGNRCFDTIVDDDLIGSEKIHGMALKRIYENDLVAYIVKTIELFKDEIDCDIHIVVSGEEEKLGLMNLKML